MRARFAALIAIIGLVLTGLPTSTLANDASADVRTFVTLHVNAVDQGETVAILRGDDVLIPVKALEQAGVHGLVGKRQTIHSDTYVLPSSLAPDVKFKLDVDSLALNVTVSPSHFGTTSLKIKSYRPANIEYTTGSSAFINYALADATGGAASAYFETGINHAEDSFHLSFTEERDSPILRGLIYYEMDDRDASIRRVAGDLDASTGDLGGSSFIGGFGISRAFDLDPYAVHYPLPSLSGVATTPSIANVYVNGVLVQRIDLPPGNFNLNDLPIATGSANAQIVVTDSFGRSSTYSQQYYGASELLTQGTSDFEYDAGLLRPNAFSGGDDGYGPAAVVGRYRTGVDASLTVGGRFEATPSMISTGPVIDFTSRLGFVHVGLAGSDEEGFSGAAASVEYGYNTPHFGFGVSLLAQGPYYANISQPLNSDRATSSLSAYASAPLGSGSASLLFSRRKMRDSGTISQLSLNDTVPIHRNYSLTFTVDRSTTTTTAPSAGFTSALNFLIGRVDGTATWQTGSTKDSGIQIQEAPEGKYGLGYFATYDPSFGHALNGSFLYRSQYGDGEVDYGSASSSTFTNAVRLSGGLAILDGVYPTSPITGAFALVDVPDTPNVQVYLANQEVGKTNASGKLLVPDLLPNFGNAIRIDDTDVSYNTSIQTVEKLIAPPARAGALVTFAAERILALTGEVVVEVKGKPVVPQYGDLVIERGDFHTESALGGKGEFYLENVPPGIYKARVLFATGECRFDFVSPQSNDMLVKMGQLKCQMP